MERYFFAWVVPPVVKWVKVSLVQNNRWWLNGHYYLLLVGTSDPNHRKLRKFGKIATFQHLFIDSFLHPSIPFRNPKQETGRKKGFQPTLCFFFPPKKSGFEWSNVLKFWDWNSFLGWSWAWYCWLEEIPNNHLGCVKPCKYWDKLHINWCRISEPSTVWLEDTAKIQHDPARGALNINSWWRTNNNFSQTDVQRQF